MSILDNEGHDPNGLGNRPPAPSAPAGAIERPNCDRDKLICPVAAWADKELARLRSAPPVTEDRIEWAAQAFQARAWPDRQWLEIEESGRQRFRDAVRAALTAALAGGGG